MTAGTAPYSGSFAADAGNAIPDSGNYNVADTGATAPGISATLTDNHGNSVVKTFSPTNIDPRRPPAATSLTLASATGPSLVFGGTAPDLDVASYVIDFLHDDLTSAYSLTCPGSGCTGSAGTSATPNSVTFAISNSTFAAQSVTGGLLPGTPYKVGLHAVDAHGNAGPSLGTPISIGTRAEPVANLTVKLLSGTGGLGSTFQIFVNTSTPPGPARNASSYSLDLSALGIGTGEPAITLPTGTLTVSAGSDTPTISGHVWSGSGQTGESSLVSVFSESPPLSSPQFDARAPTAPTGLQAVPLTGGDVQLSWTPGADAHLPTNDRGYSVQVTPAGGATSTYFVNGATPSTQIGPINMSGPTMTVRIPSTFVTLGVSNTFRVNLADSFGNSVTGPTVSVVPTLTPYVIQFDAACSLAATCYTASWPSVAGTWNAPTSMTPDLGLWVQAKSGVFAASADRTGQYWNGGDPSLAASWSSTTTFLGTVDPAWHGVNVSAAAGANLPATSGLFSTTVLSDRASGQTGSRAATLPEGNYTIGFEFNASSPAYARWMNITYDKSPASTSVGYATGFSSSTGLVQGAPIRVRTDANDLVAGVQAVQFDLVPAAAASGAPSTSLAGTPASIVCTTSDMKCRAGAVESNAINETGPTPTLFLYHTNTSLAFPTVRLGAYKVRVNVTDMAGNLASQTLTQIDFLPRVILSQAHAPPTVDDSRALYWNVYAGYDGVTPIDPNEPCVSHNACRVTNVQMQVKVHGAADSTALNLGAAVAIPTPSDPAQFLADESNLAWVYNYTADQGTTLPSSITDKNSADIRAVVMVSGFSSSAVPTIATPWTRLTPIGIPAGLGFLPIGNGVPSADNMTYMNGTPGQVRFNTSFERSGLDLVPNLTYTLFVDKDGNSGAASCSPTAPAGASRAGCYARFDTTSVAYDANPITVARNVTTLNRPTSGEKSPYYFNFSNNATLPRGRYILNISVPNPADAAHPLASATRYFNVENRNLSVEVATQPHIFGTPGTTASFVGQSFGYQLRVVHGFANFTAGDLATATARGTSIPSLRFVLRNATGAWIHQGEQGFMATFDDAWLEAPDDHSIVNVTIRLPDNVVQGSTFDVFANATSNAWVTVYTQPWFASGATPSASNATVDANATSLRTVRVDTQPPASEIDLADTNATVSTNANGAALSKQPTFYVTATDPGAGVKEVQVRIVDLNTTQTLVWNASFSHEPVWAAGYVDSWLSSELLADRDGSYTRMLTFVSTLPNGGTIWRVTNEAHARYTDAAGTTAASGLYKAITFERNHTYEVDVRARDNLAPAGEFPVYANRTAALDVQLPTVSAPALATSTGTALANNSLVDWHASGTFSVTANDTTCVAMVRLVVTPPSNATFTSNLTRPATYGCNRVAGQADAPATWTIDLAQHPELTTEVGKYVYYAEAIDGAGHVARSTTGFWLNVRDTQKAIVVGVLPEPGTIPAGTTSRVRAEVFENSEIAYVRAILQTKLPSGAVCGQGSSSCVYAEGKMTPDVCPPPIDASGHSIGDPRPVAANGTGCYVIDTTQMLRPNGATVGALSVGDYLWTVRAYDAQNATTCADGNGNLACDQKTALLIVSNTAPAVIVLDQPVNGTTVVNATPTFKWRLLDPNATASSIHVEATDINGTLVEVTPTKTALDSGGAPTGYAVTYAPGVLTNFTNYSVRIRATSTSGFAVSLTTNYTVDAIAPTARANVTGTVPIGNTTFAVAGTRVTLEANDSTSAAVTLTVSVNGGAPVAYAGPITPDGPDGLWTLTFTARDAAGNAFTDSVRLTLDKTGPQINVATQGDQVAFTVTDAGAGVDEGNVTVHYAYGDAPSFSIAKATRSAGNLYTADLKGNATQTGLRYYLEAKDVFGNLGTKYSALQPFVINAQNSTPTNLPPKVTITAPLADSKHRGAVDLKWIASDPENLPVSVTVALREPTGSGKFLVTGGSNTGALPVNLSGLGAGPYTLVITVSDGVSSAQDQVTFTVVSGDVVTVVTPPDQKVEPGRAVRFVVGINPIDKSVRTATYTLLLDGATVGTGPLTSTGGVWAASVSPTAAGAYTVMVSATYDDGTTEPATQVATFTVQSAAPPSSGGLALPGSLIVLLAIAILTIALAAYGAFVRWSK